MARVELGASRVRAKRHARIIRLALASVAAVLVIFGLIAWSTWAPFWRIKTITVAGVQTLSTSTVADYVAAQLQGTRGFVFAKDNIFLYPKQAITDSLLKDIPTLASANLSLQNFSTLGVTVVERQPKALWCGQAVASSTLSDTSQCYILDSSGAAYAPAYLAGDAYERYYGALVGSALPKQYLAPAQFQGLSALVDALAAQESADSILSVAVDSNSDVTVSFGSGFQLLFSLNDASGDVFERFTLALQSQPFEGKQLSDFQYLDLRFGSKLYYKVKTQ